MPDNQAPQSGRPGGLPNRVAIVTDSVAQVPPEVVRRLAITVVPFPVILDGTSLRDGVDITAEDLYRRMRQEKAVPSTSHPSIGEFADAFRARLKEGAEAVVYIGLGASVSGATPTAAEAAEVVRGEFPGRAVQAMDSQTVTIAEGFVVMDAAERAAQNASLEEVIACVEETRQKVGFVASLDTLEYLARGGRVGRVASMMGNLLSVKPIVSVDAKEGVIPVGRTRGNHAALEFMVEYAASRAAGRPVARLGVMQADAQERAAELQQMAEAALHPREVYLTTLTPVMGAHAGPGIVGLAYQWE
jgi:DegV family protein with EDD domain